MPRLEDHRLLTGSGSYTADANLPGQLHVAFLRADRAHAEIIRLNVSRALAHPGVKAVLTGEDVRQAGYKSLPNPVGFTGVEGQKLCKPYFGALAIGRVRYVGEAVAMIVAESHQAADDARELIDIEYRDLPVVTGIAAALAPDTPRIHPEANGNLAFQFESGDAQAVAVAFERARFVSKLTMESQRVVGNPLEPRGFLVSYDSMDDRYLLRLPIQGAAGMRGQLAYATGLPADKIVVDARDIGGSFGIRGAAYPEYLAAMIAARRLGRPLKWVGSRGECFTTDYHGRAISLTGEIALDAEGRMLALRFDDVADLGAYAAAFGAFIGTKNLLITMGGVYDVPALYGRTRLVFTNTTPISAYRGAGRPDIAYAIERLIDHAAHEHGLDPIELRRRNFISRDAMPYKTAIGTEYDSGDFEAVMNDALSRADWSGFPARSETSRCRGRLRGRGIATYLEAGGGGSARKDQALAEFDARGDLTLYAVTQSSGQGHETLFPQIVADVLGTDTEHIRFHAGRPQVELMGSGTGGSRGALGTGSAFRKLGEKLLEVARPFAAAHLKVNPHELDYRKGYFTSQDRSIGFFDLARNLATTAPHPMNCIGEGNFGMSFPNGCHIAEVEIDPETGAVTVDRYTAVDDLGHVINPILVEGQVHGGVLQGAGQVLAEHAFYDASGQLLTASFADYAMPRAGMIKTMTVHDHPVPTPTNALGAKGVGESGCSGSIPALANAVIDALHPLGVQHLDMPLTPCRVWQAIRARRSAT